MLTPEGVKSIADLISAIAWPVIALVFIRIFHREIINILKNMTKFKGFGFEAEIKAQIETELRISGEAPSHGTERLELPTNNEVNRAKKVEGLLKETDISFLRSQVAELAQEYESVRASMPPGDPRTRAMEVVVSKMRTIGRAAFPLRYELKASPSPGKRLQAIASLQVNPDYDELLDWLAERIGAEQPFVAYHAIVALNSAASDEKAPIHVAALERALAKARAQKIILSFDSDRQRMLDEFELRVNHLQEKQRQAVA